MGPSNLLKISVIVPVHGGRSTLGVCLSAIASQLLPGDELIVVDDGSPEPVPPAALPPGTVLYRLDRQSGPAAARNRGAAQAQGSLLAFFDADVVPHDDVLARARARFDDVSVGALIGSYDEQPAAAPVVSRFKNLAHSYFHQRGAGDVSSFWGACGFVRRELFVEAGGFDAQRYREPSIEDVDLGWRLKDRGARIVLDPQMRVRHLKRWTFGSLVTTDTLRRAAPWVQASLERGALPDELNASAGQRVALVLTAVWVAAGGAALIVRTESGLLPLVAAVAVTATTLINLPLFAFLWRKGGLAVSAAGVLLQQVYYLCALAGTVVGAARYALRRRATRGSKVLGHV